MQRNEIIKKLSERLVAHFFDVVAMGGGYVYQTNIKLNIDNLITLLYHNDMRGHNIYNVFAYKDKSGKSPIESYVDNLASKGDKDSRIKALKIRDYIAYLREHGQQAREPYAKHLDGEIWELRPIRDRILYAAWDGNIFILLHLFKKDTQKTPRREIEQAKRNLADYMERSKEDE